MAEVDGDPGSSQGRPASSPIWADALSRARAALQSARPHRERPADEAMTAAATISAQAHSRLVQALERRGAVEETVGRLAAEASRLLLAVSELWRADHDGDDRRGDVTEALENRLRAHEADVLSGELTYAITSDDAQLPAARLREALALLRQARHPGHGDMLSLQVAAVDLAALMVRAAGNLAATGRARDAAVERAAAPDGTLRSIAAEIATRADELRRSSERADDFVAHHLCAALRVPVSRSALQALSGPAHGPAPDSDVLAPARSVWLALAAREHVVVAALDAELAAPAYSARFETLTNAVVEGAANVACGGRLIGRAETFRHRKAWGTQTVMLSHAIEAYVSGLRGHREGFARAQLIVLTRLVRAAAAIAVLDLLATAPRAGNGRVSRPSPAA